MAVALALALASLALALAGCTGTVTPPPSTDTTDVSTVVTTRTVPAPATTFTPAPAATVKPLPPGAKPHAGEKEKSCPYIKAGLNQQPTSGPNVADIEGDHVYRTTVLTRYRPVGCRFYFYAPPYEAVADIRPTTFASDVEAFNAMVRTAEAGKQQITEKDFVKGLTGICFRTKYFGPDHARDWAFAFAKGKVMVVVYTQRDDTSRNALYLGQAIAAKF